MVINQLQLYVDIIECRVLACHPETARGCWGYTPGSMW